MSARGREAKARKRGRRTGGVVVLGGIINGWKTQAMGTRQRGTTIKFLG